MVSLLINYFSEETSSETQPWRPSPAPRWRLLGMLREGWALALQLESCLSPEDFRPPAVVMSRYQLRLRGIDVHAWGNPRHPIKSLCSIKVQADSQPSCQQQNNPKPWENLYRLPVLKKSQVVQNPQAEFCSEHPAGLKREGRVTSARRELPPLAVLPAVGWEGSGCLGYGKFSHGQFGFMGNSTGRPQPGLSEHL